jgi:protein-tyrosine phosphatase
MPARVVPLEGGRNFRDLGGYETREGLRVRWGRLFRSGSMSHLTTADERVLGALGIRVVVDLRSPTERAHEPTAWRPEHVRHVSWDYDFRNVSMRAMLREFPVMDPESVRGGMQRLYRSFPNMFAQPYAELLRHLASGDLPLVFHCAAGKDRTGLAAALVLLALGVPRATVIDDYTLTNETIDLTKLLHTYQKMSIGVGDDAAHSREISPEARAVLMAAHPSYLEAALEAIDEEHGSLDAYLQQILGVTEALHSSLRAHLLEDAR